MDLPSYLKDALEIEYYKAHQSLKQSSKEISEKYRFKKRDGSSLLNKKEEALAYALTRMPATYGAVSSSILSLKEVYDTSLLKTAIDVGAGSGSATFSMYDHLELESYACLEKESVMKEIGETLMHYQSELKDIPWTIYDITKEDLNKKADLVISSYMINELNEDKKEEAILKLWNATNQIFILLEPATPIHYLEMMNIRNQIIQLGGYVLAPCPHQHVCLNEEKWCHFSVRVSRSKLHKTLKQGEVGYEDEKFTYMIFSKNPPTQCFNRILRHPKIENGKVTLQLCTKDDIHEEIVTKKNKELFKKAKKSSWGDSF